MDVATSLLLSLTVVGQMPDGGSQGAEGASSDVPQGIVCRGRRCLTSFENINADGSDATDFFVGPFLFSGGAAGSRMFPPGYNTGAFAWITAADPETGFGFSTIRARWPFNRVVFHMRDIVELNENVQGTMLVISLDRGFEALDVTDEWTRVRRQNVLAIVPLTNGVTNIDDFKVVRRSLFDVLFGR